ncbi:MAG: thermonuclease family protein [Pseudomonadales bacterium]|nr:thermonuclease family protein [Pseudomonadales bacterium]
MVDGDTLLLADGRRVRLIGVNTPELDHRGAADEPGAQEAARFAAAFLVKKQIGLVFGVGARDRYGRVLAHVYSASGASLEEALLDAGFARHIVVPPNTVQADCLAGAEQRARTAHRGLWGSGTFLPRDTALLRPGENGFRLLQGRVSAVEKSKSSWWIELDDRVSLRIDRSDQKYFRWEDVARLDRQVVEVRGWLAWRGTSSPEHPPWLMRLRHPLSLHANRD